MLKNEAKQHSATKSVLINRFGQIQTSPPSDGLCLVELFMRLEGQEKKILQKRGESYKKKDSRLRRQ